jgi:hypothetical protein
MIYPDSSNIIPSVEEFNDFVNNLGLSFGLNSPLNLGGLLSEHELTPEVSQRNGTRGSASRLSVDDDHTQPAQTGQMLTLLPIPLNPWCTPPFPEECLDVWGWLLMLHYSQFRQQYTYHS